jgi:hypothetical protein
MLGNEENKGLISSSIGKFFTAKEEADAASGDYTTNVSVEIIEIYNEKSEFVKYYIMHLFIFADVDLC